MTTGDNPHDETQGTSQVFLVPIPNPNKDEDTKTKEFLNRPRKGGNSIWDWLDLISKLAIPIVVLIATIGFGWWQSHLADMQHTQDQLSVQDQQRATILQTYIDNIQDLLLNHNLLKSKPDDDVAILARARTLTALQGLDPGRKGRLLIFLHEAQLIGFDDKKGKLHDPIIALGGADLTNVDLTNADLTGATLGGADLTNADLSSADLSSANLIYANLTNANLYGAFLTDANLSNGNLSNANLIYTHLSNANLSVTTIYEANLSEADLSNANLTYAFGLTQQQLDQVSSCKNAILIEGTLFDTYKLTCHHN